MGSVGLQERHETRATAIEQALIGGDLSQLSPADRVDYYRRVCESLGLNPLTKPFAYIVLNGKLQLYALKDCTEQLRKLHGVSIVELTSQRLEDVFVVTAKALLPGGRADAATGAVAIGTLKGEALANALMKAETKAKRRATLSICGLGMLDETEAESIQAGEPSGYTVTAPAVTPRLTAGATAVNESGVEPSVPNGGDSGRSTPLGGSNYATRQNPHTRPDLPEGAVRIERIDSSPTKNANVTKYRIVLSTGEQVTTIKTQLASLCEQLCQENAAVTVETKDTRWGVDLLSVHRVPVDTGDEFPPLDPDDPLPF